MINICAKEELLKKVINEQETFILFDEDFIEVLEKFDKICELTLWFGRDTFSRAKIKILLECLRTRKYKGQIKLNLVDEETGDIEITAKIDLFRKVSQVKITVLKKNELGELAYKYEKADKLSCELTEGQEFISLAGQRPVNFCVSAWMNLEPFVYFLNLGAYAIYDEWMKNPYQAIVSCNDGVRPVSFLLESFI